MKKSWNIWKAAGIAFMATMSLANSVSAQIRPPAVPLVTHDPYFSVWSFNNTLAENWTHHWTGAINAMVGLVMIDYRPYRFLGPMPDAAPAMKQTGLEVTPTKTTYTLEANGLRLKLSFLSPLLMDDIDQLSRPVTYVNFEAESIDGHAHSVRVYFDVTGEWVVNRPDQRVAWQRVDVPGLKVTRIGTDSQQILNRAGDDLRIDWGHLYVAAGGTGVSQVTSSDRDARDTFFASGKLPTKDDTRMPRPASDAWPVIATSIDLGRVGRAPVSRHLMLGYDQVYAIELMKTKLKPYWSRNGLDMKGLLKESEKNYASLTKRCSDFDKKLTADLTRIGGKPYAELCTLSYRQCLAANVVAAGTHGEPLQFPKENFSNGCISTVDVIYPSAPMFLLFNTKLLKAQLTPVLDYAVSGRWKFPFAPHDLGTYPLANGQVYGGGERNERDQMPVEESGNMLLMLAAMSKIDGNAEYAKKYWPEITRWAEYLKDKGLDPENQLCTDDFAGHLAHNTNLSLKAILALAGYADMAKMLGHAEISSTYFSLAREMATKWQTMAKDGDHYRLTFDREKTWSQKYNLVWDKLLNYSIFPPDLARTEITYYKKMQNKYGLPLDNRSKYTKLDWTVWTATMADKKSDFETLVNPLMLMANESTSRVPLTDWFWTHDAKQTGFQARSVVGGVFIKMLEDPQVWKKWASLGERGK